MGAQLAAFPAVALLGPRQVGKFTFAYRLRSARQAFYLDAQDPRDLAKLQEPVAYLEGHQARFVLIDEVQCLPDLFEMLRGRIDARRRQRHRAGHFLLLGFSTACADIEAAECWLVHAGKESFLGRHRVACLT